MVYLSTPPELNDVVLVACFVKLGIQEFEAFSPLESSERNAAEISISQKWLAAAYHSHWKGFYDGVLQWYGTGALPLYRRGP